MSVAATGTHQRLTHFTPLRYPGGKGKLAPFIKNLIEANDLFDGEYIEPYAGGAAIAIELLLQEYVSEIHINDLSRSVHAFWRSVLNHTEEMMRRIRDTPLSVKAWDKHKRILKHEDDFDEVDLGFAMFYLNRTSRSGILNGGIIGGRSQTGPWKMDARYNAPELINRVQSIARLGKRIHLSCEDALEYLGQGVKKWSEKSLIYLDPPYYNKGHQLYYNYYKHNDHLAIAKAVQSVIKRQRWIVSYDDVEPIRDMYAGTKALRYTIGYSARDARDGAEVMFFCNELAVPQLAGSMRLLKVKSAKRNRIKVLSNGGELSAATARQRR